MLEIQVIVPLRSQREIEWGYWKFLDPPAIEIC
jgi:hypothetical protein